MGKASFSYSTSYIQCNQQKGGVISNWADHSFDTYFWVPTDEIIYWVLGTRLRMESTPLFSWSLKVIGEGRHWALDCIDGKSQGQVPKASILGFWMWIFFTTLLPSDLCKCYLLLPQVLSPTIHLITFLWKFSKMRLKILWPYLAYTRCLRKWHYSYDMVVSSYIFWLDPCVSPILNCLHLTNCVHSFPPSFSPQPILLMLSNGSRTRVFNPFGFIAGLKDLRPKKI